MVLKYNHKPGIRIVICFDKVDEFLEFRKFRKKENITPISFNPDDIVYGKVYMALYNEKDAGLIREWLKGRKAREDKRIWL